MGPIDSNGIFRIQTGQVSQEIKGFSPFQLVFDANPRLQLDLIKDKLLDIKNTDITQYKLVTNTKQDIVTAVELAKTN